MRRLAIDPGPEQSGYVVLDDNDVLDDNNGVEVRECATWNNVALVDRVLRGDYDVLVLEMIETWGMAVGRSVFETLYWMGRFHEAAHPVLAVRITRKNVMLTITGQRNAKPAEMREAMLDRFGPGLALAVGTKKAQGPLYQVRGHQWAALALAVAHREGAALYDYLNNGRKTT